jgi:hypothetical protein
MFYFTSAATIRKPLEVLLKDMQALKRHRKGRNGVRDEIRNN